MKVNKIIAFSACALTALSVATTVTHQVQAQQSEETSFICASGFDKATNQRHPTTYAWTQRGKIAVVRWKYNWFNNADYTPQRRCQDVSKQFQTAYNNQTIDYITNGTENAQEVICAAHSEGGACATTLLTLRPGDDSLKILTQLKERLGGRATRPIDHSSGKRQVYYKIDIDKFLQTAPVESE